MISDLQYQNFGDYLFGTVSTNIKITTSLPIEVTVSVISSASIRREPSTLFFPIASTVTKGSSEALDINTFWLSL